MKINEMPALQMQGFENVKNTSALSSSPYAKILSSAEENQRLKEKSFGEYLSEAFSAMNKQQNDVSSLERQLITDPDSVDIHDVTTAMAKAQQSMSLAKTVVDRIVSGWNEISTTR